MNYAGELGQQFVVFSIVLATGFLAGLLFDVMRAARKILRLPRNLLFLADLLLCLIAALAVYQFLFLCNRGEAGFYVHLSFSLGICFYYYFCSRHLYKGVLHALKCIQRFWQKAKILPAKEK